MGLIKVLPEQKKRKRVKRGGSKVASEETVATPTPKQTETPYFDDKEVHVIVGDNGIEISELPRGYDEDHGETPVTTVTTDTNSFIEEVTEPLNYEIDEVLPESTVVEAEEEEKIVVPESFMKWLEEADRNQGVFKAYNSLVNDGEQENIDWVDSHQDEFMLIWKGELIPEVEEALYETAMFNYGKYPNVLVKTLEGKIMMKTYEDMLATDELHLTEEEIREDWTFLFENGFSKRVHFE